MNHLLYINGRLHILIGTRWYPVEELGKAA